MRKLPILITALLVLAGFVAPAWAQPDAWQRRPPVLELGAPKKSQELGPYISVMESPNLSLTPEQAASPSRYKDYRTMRGKSLRRNYSEAVFWLCFRLRQKKGVGDGVWLLNLGWTRLFAAQLYMSQSSGGVLPEFKDVALHSDPIQDRGWRHPTFLLNLQPGVTYTFYLKLQPYRNLTVQPSLSRKAVFSDTIAERYLFYGVYYGLILALLLYNLAAFLALGDRSYLWYVIYGSIFLLYIASYNGLLTRWLPPMELEAAKGLDLAIMSLMFVGAAQIVRSFLNTRRYDPLLEKLLLTYMAGAMLLAALTPFFPMKILYRFYFWGAIGPILMVWASLNALRRGFGPAGYFLAAWLVLALGSLTMVFSLKGLLPLNFLIINSLQISSAFEMVLLSLALSARIKRIHLERQSLAISEKRYRKLSQTDALTALYNKRYMMDWLIKEARPSKLGNQPFSMIIMDVDDFKAFNDSYGHPAGDIVLMTLAGIIDHNARQGDIACRYGGEEFVVILPGASAQQAEAVAERIRSDFESQAFSVKGGQKVSATVSLGVAQMKPGENSQDLLERADRALYLAKGMGKNRILLAS